MHGTKSDQSMVSANSFVYKADALKVLQVADFPRRNLALQVLIITLDFPF